MSARVNVQTYEIPGAPMKSPKKTVSRRKFIEKSSLLSLPGRTAIHEKRGVEWKEAAL